eukprot:613595_1
MQLQIDHKDSSEESTSDEAKKHPQSKSHLRQKSMMVLAEMKPSEQEETAQDIFAQIKQLKEHNQAMGYHLSGNDLQAFDTDDLDRAGACETPRPPRPRAVPKLSKHVHIKSNSVILPETAGLKQKLENISSAINSIMLDLQAQNSADAISETIKSFQNQLTEIQDQVEDAENDIESNIDVKFIGYHEEIKLNKQKVKRMKKERKQQEKQKQMEKEKEQQNLIELQRLQIEQLSMQKTLSPEQRNVNRRGRDSAYFTLDSAAHSVSPRPGRRTTFQQIGMLQHIEDDDVYDQDEEYVPAPHGYNTEYLMQPPNTIGPGMSHEMVSYNEGHQSKDKRPMLSDNAIKIIGGVVIVLAGLWIISKYVDSKRGNEPSYMRGRPSSRYTR